MISAETPPEVLPEDVQAKRFYDSVRENIIAILLFLSFFSVSHIILQRFRRKYKAEDIEDEEEDVYGIDNMIMMVLCAIGLAMALGGFFLLPGTMAATALIELQNGNYKYYLGWLDTNLLVTLWNYTFILCNISLFGLLPFAYFYNETDQLKTFFVKTRETLTIMTLVGILIYGFIYVSKSILQMDEIPELVILNLLTCLGGAVICLTATPRGYIQIFSWISRLPLRPNYRKSLKDKLTENKTDTSLWERKLEELERALDSNNSEIMSRSATFISSTPESYSSSSQRLYLSTSNLRSRPPLETLKKKRIEILAQLKRLESERRQIQFDLSHSPLYRNISFVVLILLGHFIFLLLFGYIAFNFMKGIFVFEDGQQQTLESVFGRSSFLTMFGAVGTLSEISLILYFTFATIIGVFTMWPFNKIRPRWRRMTMQQTIGNVALLLVISSSLPALVRVLGLTRFESAGPYENFHMLKNRYLMNMGFRAGALITSVFAILDYYVLGSLQRVRRSISNSGGGHEWNNTNGYHYHHYQPHYENQGNGYAQNVHINGESFTNGNETTSYENSSLYANSLTNGHTNGHISGYIAYTNGYISDESR